MSLYVIKTLAALDKFLAGFYVSNKVNFQNYFANGSLKWFVFEADTRSTCFISAIASCFKPNKILPFVKLYIINYYQFNPSESSFEDGIDKKSIQAVISS